MVLHRAPRSPPENVPQLQSPGTDRGSAGTERAINISLIKLLLFLLTSWDLERAFLSQSLHLHLQPPRVPPTPAAERGVRSLQAPLRTDLV